MKEGRDFSLIYHINGHYKDLVETLNELGSFELFVIAKDKRKSVLFDFLQIGELFNQLSPKFRQSFDNKNKNDLIAIRNRIVHGYSTIIDDLIYKTITINLPLFLKDLNIFSVKNYKNYLSSMMGKYVTVYIKADKKDLRNRPNNKLIKGYLKELTSLDGQFQEAYVFSENPYIEEFSGRVVAIHHNISKGKESLIVVARDSLYSLENIEKQIEELEKQ